MKDPKQEKFLSLKNQVLDNLLALKLRLEECTETGMPDPTNEMYNHITNLIDETEVIDIVPEIEIQISRGKDMEKRIDTWLASQGNSSMQLLWPDFSTP